MKTIDLRDVSRLQPDEGSDKPGSLGVLVFDTEGQPVNVKVALGTQVVNKQRHILIVRLFLARMGDQAFTAGLEDQLEAAELVEAARDAIKEQFRIDDGLVVLEDAHCTRLCEAILKPRSLAYDPEIQHNLLAVFRACKNPVSGDLRKKLAEEAAPAEAPPDKAEAAPAN